MAVSSGVIALCLIGLTSYLTTNLQSLSSEPKIAWGHGYMDKAYDHLVSELADGSHDAPHGTVDEHNATGAVANISNVTTPAPLPPGEIAVGEFVPTTQHAEPLPLHGALAHLEEPLDHHAVKMAFEGEIAKPNSQALTRFHHLRERYFEGREAIMSQLEGTKREANALVAVCAAVLFLALLTETAFGMIEDFITEETEKLVRTVLQELTVLGCISMFVFLAVKSGIPPDISDSVSHPAWHPARHISHQS